MRFAIWYISLYMYIVCMPIKLCDKIVTFCYNINNLAAQVLWAVDSTRSPRWRKHTTLCQTFSAVWSPSVCFTVVMHFSFQLWQGWMSSRITDGLLSAEQTETQRQSQSLVFLTHVCYPELSNTHCMSMTEIWTLSNWEFMTVLMIIMQPVWVGAVVERKIRKNCSDWMCKADKDSRL